MELKDLRYVIAIKEYGSISKAAESLFISQPALSQQLKRIEQQLGTELFRRVNNRLVLTNAGEIIAREGKSIIQSYDFMISRAVFSQKQQQEVLRFGISPFYSKYYLPRILHYYSDNIPNVRLEIVEKLSSELENDVENGLLPLCFVPQFPEHPNLDYETIATEEILLGVPYSHPINAYAESIDGKNLYMNMEHTKYEDFILQPEPQKVATIQDSIFNHYGFSPNVVYKTTNWDTIRVLTASGLGLSFLPELFSYPNLRDSSINLYHIAGIVSKRPYALAYRHGRIINSLEEQLSRVFIKTLQEMKENPARSDE